MGLLGSIIGGIASAISGDSVTWYCDECDAIMNNQPGFNTASGVWTCTECGCENDVSDSNVFDSEEEYLESLEAPDCPQCGNPMTKKWSYSDWYCYNCNCGLEDEEDEEDDDESLSVYDAAEIWQSNGYDEDYTFGYSEEELRRALK